MCDPEYYSVKYSINPYMDPHKRPVDRSKALIQWNNLHDLIKHLGGKVTLIDGHEDFPDMVYTANAGMFVGATMMGYELIMSEFYNNERRGENVHYQEQIRSALGEKFVSSRLPANLNEGPSFECVYFEGQGDVVKFGEDITLIGHGRRTNFHGAKFFAGREFLFSNPHIVKLIDDRWYHLDTCLAYHEFSDGTSLIMYVPKAFNEYDRRLIDYMALINDSDVLKIMSDDEATALVCNSIVVNDTLIIHEPENKEFETVAKLMDYCNVETVDLSEFIKGGGSVRCLTLDVPF